MHPGIIQLNHALLLQFLQIIGHRLRGASNLLSNGAQTNLRILLVHVQQNIYRTLFRQSLWWGVNLVIVAIDIMFLFIIGWFRYLFRLTKQWTQVSILLGSSIGLF